MNAPCLHVLAPFIVGAAPVVSLTQSVTGTWQWSGRNESGILLKTVQAGSKVRFQLEVSRGAPSYNSGYVAGEFQLTRTVGTFASSEKGHECEITFTFQPKRVEVSQSLERGECGFGGGVHADGMLSLQSNRVPKLSQCDPRVSKP
jgi:hypothetical protein